MSTPFDINEVLDMTKWAQLQEKIAIATHFAILLVDYRGKPLTYHSQVKPFCQLARSHPELGQYCEKCDARGGLEAVRTGQPYIYRCHFDIIDMAIPIMVDQHYAGAIMAGEILLDEHQSDLEQVLNLADRADVMAFKAQHQELIDTYPRFSMTDLKHTAAMLEELSEYIVTEAIKKDYLIKAYKQTLRISKKTPLEDPSDDDQTLEYLKNDIHHSLLEKRLKEDGVYQAKNRTLQPAIDAVFANKNDHLSLQNLAEMVNLSPTYLSRLLRAEFGEPFSQIYAKLKIHWAEELLVTTNLSIREISDELGFMEPSYFIRSFKRIKGTTPYKWRQTQTKT